MLIMAQSLLMGSHIMWNVQKRAALRAMQHNQKNDRVLYPQVFLVRNNKCLHPEGTNNLLVSMHSMNVFELIPAIGVPQLPTNGR